MRAGTTGRSSRATPAVDASRRPGWAASRRAGGTTPGPGDALDGRELGQQRLEKRRSPRSLPYDVEFSLTSKQLAYAVAASHLASSTTSVGRLDRNEPRNRGIAQKEQRRSHPDASLSGAIGPDPRRRRIARGPLAGACPLAGPARTGRVRAPIRPAGRPVDGRERVAGSGGRPDRGRRGFAGDDAIAAGRDLRIVVEPQDRVRLRQGLGSSRPYRSARQPTATTARATPSRFRSAASRRASTESFFAASTNPQVLTTTSSADSALIDEHESTGVEPGGELLGVHVVAGTAQGDERDGWFRVGSRRFVATNRTRRGHETGSGRPGGGAVDGAHKVAPVCRLGRYRQAFQDR